MKNFTKILMAIFFATCLSNLIAQESKAPLPNAMLPYLQNPTEDGMTVCFLAKDAKDVMLDWKQENTEVSNKIKVEGKPIFGTPWTIWKMRIKGLKPNTKYNYQVQYNIAGKDTTTSKYSFKTLDKKAKSLKVALFNDLHNRENTLSELMKNVKPTDYEYSILMGDCFADPSFENVFKTMNDFVPLLDASNKPMFLIKGNHETRNIFSYQLAMLFDLPNLDDTKPSDEQKWQFTLFSGTVKFLVMDSGEDGDISNAQDITSYKRAGFWEKYRQEEGKWLKENIKTYQNEAGKWSVFISHIPLYNNNEWSCRSCVNNWMQTLSGSKIDVMLAGHDHEWKFLDKSENPKRPFPVMIGGGPSLEEATVMLLSADENKFNIRLISAKGKLLKDFNLTK